MKNFIKELYFNNIDPQARYFEKNSYLQKQMSILSSGEQALTEKLKGEEKKTFLAFGSDPVILRLTLCGGIYPRSSGRSAESVPE